MLERIVTWVTDTVLALGYPGITILMTIESSAIPFPSEIIMAPAGYNVAHGRMSFFWVMVAGVSGSLIGALINYTVAHWLDGWLRRHGRWLLIKAASLDRAEAFFRRHGEIGTFIGRLVPVVRQLISIPAGLAGMRLDRFVVFTALGAGIWCLILTYIGYVVGQHSELLLETEVHRRVGQVLLFLLPSLALVGGIYALVYRWRVRRAGQETVREPTAP